MFIMGYDVGSSSIKGTLMDAESGAIIATATSPETELEILALNPGWAEQDPRVWWEHVINATRQVMTKTRVDAGDIVSIGISYQMHGLVVVDKNQDVLRNSIIWCDSRSVEIGEKAFEDIGRKWSLERLLNSPGNFTASKLKWIKNNEPEIWDVFKPLLKQALNIACVSKPKGTTCNCACVETTDLRKNKNGRYYHIGCGNPITS